MSNPVISWAQNNPVAAGAAALGVVVVAMLLFGGGSSEADGSGSAGAAAYYSAVANQAQAGAAIQIEQIKANASTNQVLAAAQYGLEKEKLTAANTSKGLDYNREITLTQAWYDYSTADKMIYSNERLGADTNAVNAYIATVNANRDTSIARATHSSTTAQNITAGASGLTSIVKSVLPFL